jgi:ABC-type transport system involved in multi-copper enzyme maturation permease subunit
MTFLPIVERELRVASRKRFTYWTRITTALLTLMIFAAVQMIAMTAGQFMPIQAGQIQFSILKWMGFVFACGIGVFLTSDSLSEEKREGTLGLLFLTDLRGYDVVLGKLMSQFLRAFYGLLAAFPIMGLSLLTGGLTVAEFWRGILVICNTVWLSLSIGLFVSVLSRDSTKAMNGAVLMTIFVLGGLPLLDLCIARWDPALFQPWASLGSPVWLFTQSGAWRSPYYWPSLGIQHLLAWVLLGLTCLRAPRTWQEKSASGSAGSTISQRWRFGSPKVRLALRRKLLERDPVRWLSVRDRWLPRLLLGATLVVVTIFGLGLTHRVDSLPLVLFSSFQAIFTYALILWVASHACRFFVDAMRNGALELLLVTPLNPSQIVRGQWLGLCRTFALPVVLVVLMQLASGIANYLQMSQSMRAASARGGSFSVSIDPAVMGLVGTLTGSAELVGGLAAMAWFGMWMGLTNRKHSIAILKTICFVGILPSMAITFAYGMIMMTLMFAQVPFWMGMIVQCAMVLTKDGFFIVWSHRKLSSGFRDAVARAGMGTIYRTLPIPLQAPPPVPRGVAAVAAPVGAVPPAVSAPPVLPVTRERVEGSG